MNPPGNQSVLNPQIRTVSTPNTKMTVPSTASQVGMMKSHGATTNRALVQQKQLPPNTRKVPAVNTISSTPNITNGAAMAKSVMNKVPKMQTVFHGSWNTIRYGISQHGQQSVYGISKHQENGQVKQYIGQVDKIDSTYGVTCFLNIGWHCALLYSLPPSSIIFFPKSDPLLSTSSKSLIDSLLMQAWPPHAPLTSKPYSSRSPKSIPIRLASSNSKVKSY